MDYFKAPLQPTMPDGSMIVFPTNEAYIYAINTRNHTFFAAQAFQPFTSNLVIANAYVNTLDDYLNSYADSLQALVLRSNEARAKKVKGPPIVDSQSAAMLIGSTNARIQEHLKTAVPCILGYDWAYRDIHAITLPMAVVSQDEEGAIILADSTANLMGVTFSVVLPALPRATHAGDNEYIESKTG